jgi:hypothetical protein
MRDEKLMTKRGWQKKKKEKFRENSIRYKEGDRKKLFC